ncbi:Ig-like domain-containing protein [Holdemania filiformis]|uniref:Ig-like domain-containing protein n=1 Tax=Holdemania filiformis TaxID=61171 RepID=UPI00267471B1|nr:Ig-like domain-containing protein [Holdemania filiformis]
MRGRWRSLAAAGLTVLMMADGCMPQPSGVLRCDWAKMLAETLFFDTSAAGLAALKDWGVEVEADRQRISRTAACINLLQAYDGEAQSLDRCQTLGFLTKLDGWLTAEEAASSLMALTRSLNEIEDQERFEWEKAGLWGGEARPDETGRIALEPTQSGQVGQWFTDPDKNEVYVTDSLVETEDQILAEVHSEDPQTWLAETQFNLSFDADWSQAEILPYAQDSTGLLPVAMNLSEAAEPRFALMKQQFEIGGTQVNWSVAASGIHVHAAKKMTNGATLQMDYDLTDVHPVIAWNGLGKEGRLQLDFTMSESAGLTRGVSNTLTSDFSGLDPHDLLSSLTASFTNARKEADTVIPIAKIKLPVPQFPIVDLLLTLQLHCYAGGKIELLLSQEGSVGMEIRNGVPRLIHQLEHRHDFIFQGSSKMTAAVEASARAAGISLMDLLLQTGLRGVMRTTAWIGENGGLEPSEAGELPLESQPVHANLQFCSDLNVHGILELEINSSDSLAGRLGMGRTFSILNENNATLNPHGRTHLENGIFVDHCTRGQHASSTPTPAPIIKTDRIELAEVQLILSPGQSGQIVIRGLPEGVAASDLIYSIAEPDIATVVQTGRVRAVKAGDTIITITEPTETYKTSCHIHVRTEAA